MAKSALFSLIILLSIASVTYSQDICDYYMTVATGDKDGAGTDAMVSVRMFDIEGNMAPVRNLRAWGFNKLSHDYFENDKVDAFNVYAICLNSPVCKVELSISEGDNGPTTNPDWFVDYVQISSITPPVMSVPVHRRFRFNKWVKYQNPVNATLGTCS